MTKKNLQSFRMAEFALSRRFSEIPSPVIEQLKKHLLDSLASLIHCLHKPSVQKLSAQLATFSDGGDCPVPVLGKLPVDRAAQFYTALIRYPDFMDNFLGKEATCHPCDNIGGILAIAQRNDSNGRDLLTAMAIAYEIECRLVEEVPVMIKGFDHTLLLSYSLTAACSRLMRLTEEQTAHALAIAGCTFNPLVSCRASYTYEWKGFLSSMVALGCVNAVFLAKNDMTGPISIFEGNKGFQKEFGMELDYDWRKDRFDLIPRCILKNYNSEVHSQSLIEAALELKRSHNIPANKIRSITLTTFLTAYHIIGGGEYGDRKEVHSKEQADHSLPYVVAAAFLDGELYPDQLLPDRINRHDVQSLLKKIRVRTKFPLHRPLEITGFIDPYTRVYPGKLMGQVRIALNNGKKFSLEKEDYHGFHTRPLSWEDVTQKFLRLSKENAGPGLQEQIIKCVASIEKRNIRELCTLITKCGAHTHERHTYKRRYNRARRPVLHQSKT